MTKHTFITLFALSLFAVNIGCTSAPKEENDPSLLTDTSQGTGRIEYTSSQLMLKNSEQVAEMINRKIKQAGDIQAAQEDDPESDGIDVEQGAIDALRDGLRITFSRPDRDGTRGKLFYRLRRELTDLNAHDEAMEALADEAIRKLRSKTSPKEQATYVHLLENMMAEIKPEIQLNPTYRRIVRKVKAAEIELTDRLLAQELMRTMAKPVSPSKTASLILPGRQ